MNLSDSRGEFKLNYKTDECISSVKFSPSSSQYLLICSWDGLVTLHDIQNNQFRSKYEHKEPVLDGCFQVFMFKFCNSFISKFFDYFVTFLNL